MSDILPSSTVLPDIPEGAPVSQQFTAQLDDPLAQLISISIVAHTPNDTINVQGAGYSGAYTNMFPLGSGALKYRLKTGEIKSVSRWEDLPSPKDADLFEWNAPSVLQKQFSYSVQLVYEVQTPVDPTLPPGPAQRFVIDKTYTQLVFGDWSVWGNMLRKYVQDGRL